VTAQRLVPKPTKEGYDEPSLESPRLFTTRAIAGPTDMFWNNLMWREILPLRGSFPEGFEPLVSNPQSAKFLSAPSQFSQK